MSMKRFSCRSLSLLIVLFAASCGGGGKADYVEPVETTGDPQSDAGVVVDEKCYGNNGGFQLIILSTRPTGTICGSRVSMHTESDRLTQ